MWAVLMVEEMEIKIVVSLVNFGNIKLFSHGCFKVGRGGGGASDIRTSQLDLWSRIVVAGGGGGGTYACTGGSPGGNAGNSNGVAGGGGCGGTAIGGGAGTQSAGGAAGSSGSNYVGNPGGFGYGGNAGVDECSQSGSGYGGGGGGGYYGGGGGTNSGGGGGSSVSSPLYTSNPAVTAGYNSGNGYVTITAVISGFSI
jgi:hypothetical protein